MSTFTFERCKIYQLVIITKNSWNKSCAQLNFLKKSQWTHISTYAKSGAKELQRFVIFKIMHRSGKVASLYDWTLQKMPIISKTVWNQSCAGLNFQKKSHWMRISKYPKSGARGFQRFVFLKYYNALKWESSF